MNGVLGLRTKKVDKKVTFEIFCEKLDTYIMRELKNGEAVVVVTRDKKTVPLVVFNKENIPDELTGKDQKLDVVKDIKKEEIREFVRDTMTLTSNLEKILVSSKGSALAEF